MSAKKKMTEIVETINTKTKEYAPIVKKKLLVAYKTSKDFTINTLIPKMKEEVEILKTKIADFQANQAKKKTANTSMNEDIDANTNNKHHKKRNDS